MQIKITEKWLLDDSKPLIEAAKERQKLSRTRDRKPAAPAKVPAKAA